ncbi:hypothetical protein M0R72_17790 [Candidatus Pacearchaeota archaeon]|jgi:hypothetical protein|nr:hypothetical protein [Candidatus Pacearchaeota archaeon]
MSTTQDFLFEQITESLSQLSDKQLTNLIEVIRVTQKEREDDRIEAAAGC